MMNREAKRLHMDSTVFVNSSGWKNPQQLTTARDMAKLGRAILQEYPRYYRLFSVKKFKYRGNVFQNHNKLLGENGGIRVDGIKTGFVCASGFNIVVSASKGKNRLIVVVLGGKSPKKRNAQAQWLMSCCFNKLSQRQHAKYRQLVSKCGKQVACMVASREEKKPENAKKTGNIKRSVGSILELAQAKDNEVKSETKNEKPAEKKVERTEIASKT
jgi:D-alanyl-D-alanine carboxypeptidase